MFGEHAFGIVTIPLPVVAAALVSMVLLVGVACWTRSRLANADARIGELQAEAEREREARQNLEVRNASVSATAERVPMLEKKILELRDRLDSTINDLGGARSTLETERTSHAARLQELETIGAEIERKFAVLALDVLGKNSESFLSLVTERFETHKRVAEQELDGRKQAVEALVKPIRESLDRFESKVGDLEKAREGAYREVTLRVQHLAQGQTSLCTETSRLVQALRQPKTRGCWGEHQLVKVLEIAGMTEHVDFLAEHTVTGEDSRLRPDVIVHLPGGKSVVVDAKTPLDAYLSAFDASDDACRQKLLLKHASQVRDHVRALASQNYWKALPVTPDFVVMFLSGESFFAAAIENDPRLLEDAVKSRVLISTPMTLVALLKAIAYGWQQQKLADNTQAVATLARELYDRIKGFGEHMQKLGSALGKAIETYNKSVGTLEGRVLPSARKFERLGVVPVGSAIASLEPIESTARNLQADELIAPIPEPA